MLLLGPFTDPGTVTPHDGTGRFPRSVRDPRLPGGLGLGPAGSGLSPSWAARELPRPGALRGPRGSNPGSPKAEPGLGPGAAVGQGASGGRQLSWPGPSSWAAPRVLVKVHRQTSPFHKRAFVGNPTRAGLQPAFCAGAKHMGVPRHPRAPSPQTPGRVASPRRGEPRGRSVTRVRHRGLPAEESQAHLQTQGSMPAGTRGAAEATGGRLGGMGRAGQGPCPSRHSSPRCSSACWLGPLRAVARRGGPGATGAQEVCLQTQSLQRRPPQPLRAGAWLAVLAQGQTHSLSPGATAGATPGLWRMGTLGLSPTPVLTAGDVRARPPDPGEGGPSRA